MTSLAAVDVSPWDAGGRRIQQTTSVASVSHGETMSSGTAMVHPPGTVLQHLYLKERISRMRPGSFVEVGVGNGHVSQLLLSLGWCGRGYDLNASAVANATKLNSDHVTAGRFAAYHMDWLTSTG